MATRRAPPPRSPLAAAVAGHSPLPSGRRSRPAGTDKLRAMRRSRESRGDRGMLRIGLAKDDVEIMRIVSI